MSSTKKGLWIANIGSDDGSRLAVDGVLVYSDWVDQGYIPQPRILMSLTGSSNLQLDFYEAGGGNQISFLDFTQVLANQLASNTTQTVCQGSAALQISGDVFPGALPNGLTVPAYQWSYSTTPGGIRTNITGATSATFTPSTTAAPFNSAGTFYIFRNATLRSSNNISPNPYNASNESNAAVLTVVLSAPVFNVTAASSTFCYGNSTNINLSSSTVGVTYQLRNNANNAAIGAPVAGNGGAIALPTGTLFATTTFNVLATNSTTLCGISMTGTPTVATTPNGGKSVAPNFGLVCVGNTAKITVTNADAGVRYVLRNDFDDSPIGDTLTGVGDNLDLEVPLGYLVDPVTTFHVWAFDIASGCAGKLLDTVKIATQAFSSPVFDIDQDFCSLDSGKVLLTPTNTTFPFYLWSTDSTTTSIVIQQSGSFSLTATDINGCRTTKSVNVGEELLINGDFSLGRDVGYYTNYTWGPPGGGYPSNPQNNGFYTVAANAKNTHNDFWGRDHTSKTGNFMIVNGENSARKVWFDTVTVEANTRYYFSAWAMSLNDKPPFSIMRFKVNNILVGDSAILPPGVSNNSNYGWRRFYGQWDSGPRDSSNNRIPIEIVNLVPGNSGNDFGLDDISFSKLPPVKFFGATIGNGGNSLCLNDTLKLTASLTGGQNPITYAWAGPGGFTSTDPAPIILNAQGGWYYLTALEGRNCESADSAFIILSDPTVKGVAQGLFKCENAVIMNVTGLVPNSINNTVFYNISGAGTGSGNRIASGVDADSSGAGSFFLGTLPLALSGRTLSITSIFNGSCERNITGVSMILDVRPTTNANTSNWVGGPTGNWKDAYNWCGAKPASARDVFIPSGSIVYVSNADSAICRDITLTGTASLVIENGGRLRVFEDILTLGSGRIDARFGTIELVRNASQSISGANFLEGSISTLQLSNPGNRTITISGVDTLKILDQLLFAESTVDLITNNFVVLASSDTATARVGVLGSGNVITGDFIVERYLMNARKWRLLSAPTNRVGQTVRNSWQENGADTNTLRGHGFLAVDPRFTSANTLGFDARGNNGSVKRYNPTTDNWDAVANTNVLPISAERGYFVFVAGDRTVTFPGSKPTKFRTVGTINRGTLPNITVPANQFATIGNPYPSRIDMRNINKTVQISNTYYVWDPSLGGLYTLGAFNTFFFDGANYVNLLSSTLYGTAFTPNNFIESGMAVMVRNTSPTLSGTITFEENDKIAGSDLSSFTSNGNHRLLANLKLAPQGSNPAILLDGTAALFNENYSNQYTEEDVKKMGTVGETVSWNTSSNESVIDNRYTPAYNDTLHLQIKQMRVQNYQWELALNNMDYPGLEASFIDRFMNTSTALNMNGTTVLKFNVQNIPGSYAIDRFKIVFKPSVVLPVSFTNIAAQRNNDRSVAVQWKVENEINMDGYQVERSADGTSFETISTLVAPKNNNAGAATYSFSDLDKISTDLFYRIKGNSSNGQVQFSAIAKVGGFKTDALITVYPNPVQNKQLTIQFSASIAGNYQLILLGNNGTRVYQKILTLNNNTSTQTIQLPASIAGGKYQLQVQAPDGKLHQQQVIVL